MDIETSELEHTREEVLAKVRQTFPGEDFVTVIAILDAILEDRRSLRERVQLAVLKLSSGNVDKLLHYIETANADWRDVLVGAEYPNGDKAQHAQERLKDEAAAQAWREQDREQYLAWLYRM